MTLTDRSVLAQNMEHTRTVSRTLKPSLKRGSEYQAAPSANTSMTKRPRGGLIQANEQGDSTRREISQAGTEDSCTSAWAIRRAMSKGPCSKELGKGVMVSTDHGLFERLYLATLTLDRSMVL